MINGHTHIYSGLVPFGMPAPSQEPENFVQILERVWWRLDLALDRETLQASAEYYLHTAKSLGCTGLIDHHESPNFIEGSLDVLAEASQSAGIPTVLCYGATERNGGREEAKRGLAECARFLAENDRPMVRAAIGLHASFTVSDDTLREAATLAREHDTVLHVHVAEDLADVEDAKKRGFTGLLDRFAKCEALVSGSIFAHGVHLSKDEVLRCADEGIWLVQNPRSNQGNKVGYPAHLAESSLVALGTDGYEADMVAEHKALMEDVERHGDDPGAADMRGDGSTALFSSFWDGALPPCAPPSDESRLAEITEFAKEQAQRLWSNLNTAKYQA